VVLIRTDVSEECIASIINLTRIGERGTMLAVTSNKTRYEEILTPKLRFLVEPHCITSKKTAFFIITAVKTPKSYIALTGWVL
jgi:hypothetical protein